MENNFAIFICTHGRPNKQITLNTLKSVGYKGKWYLVLDDTDSTIQEYIDIYGAENIIVFDKNHFINDSKYDNGDNAPHTKCILYAKRAVEYIASSMGFKYFAIADDDITKLCIRYPVEDKLRRISITDFDRVLDSYVNLLKVPVAGIGFGHVTTYCPGVNTFSPKNLGKIYLPYQFIIRNGDVEVNWTSWFAEDDVTELKSSSLGNIWIVVPYVMQDTLPIGNVSANGGMTDVYKQFDMYKLNFNVIKYCPCGIYLRHKNGNKFVITRFYDKCFPKIISWRYKK